ncbi:hypothetical protein ACW9HD_26360, partial [Nocardia gipuzkoensis]
RPGNYDRNTNPKPLRPARQPHERLRLGTIWLRTGLMPRWLVIITYVLALALLLAISRVWAVALVFPAWVLMTSVYILLTNRLESHHPR